MYNEKTANAVTPLKQSEKTALLLSVEDLMPLLAIGKSSAYALVRSGQIAASASERNTVSPERR